MKICVLTNFRDDDSAYSLCNVANEQLNMLLEHGYKPKMLVTQGYKPARASANPGVEIGELPDQVRQNQVSVDETFHQDVMALKEAMLKHLADVDVVLTHDLIYQADSLKHNIALRMVAEEMPKLRFLHWIHSATSPYNLADLVGVFPEEQKKIIKQQFPNSYYIFFNHWSVPRIAAYYGVNEEFVKVVHHPTDYLTFAKYNPISRALVNKYQLFNKDYICVYPARLDTGKQLEYPIKMMGALKKLGFSVSFIALDFHSSSDDPNDDKFQYRAFLKHIARQSQLEKDEVVFISEFSPETKVRVPHDVVSDMLDLSNIFFMSSASESYSLVTQEAAMKGNLLIVNQNFPPFIEIFGPAILQFPCLAGVNIVDRSDGETKTEFSNEAVAYEELAKKVVAATSNKQEVTRRRILRERNSDYIFRHELEPLFYAICQS